MCVEEISFCGAMGVESHAKLMSSTQAVGLLAVLADSDNLALRTFSKQELWRHVLAAHTTPTVPLVQEITHQSSAQAMERKPLAEGWRMRVKKVRFAPDVVEPAGDSRAYRGKNEANLMAKTKACVVKQEHKEGCRDKKVGLNDKVLKASPATSGCKAQTLAKPYLPANRMLLYKGKQLSRSMMTLDCRV